MDGSASFKGVVECFDLVKYKVPVEIEALHQSFNHPIHTKERYELEVSAGKLFLKGFAILR